MFSITTYNILAHSAYNKWQKSCFQDDHVSRYTNLSSEMENINTDILCLQEVSSMFKPFLLEFAEKACYKTVYNHRKDDLSQPILYKCEKFELLHEWYWELEGVSKEFIHETCTNSQHHTAILSYLSHPRDYSVQVVLMLHIESSQKFYVLNIHNIWEDHMKNDAKAFHLAGVLWKLKKTMDDGNNQKDNPVIFCGDFNSYPDSPLYELLEKGSIDKHCLASSSSSPLLNMQRPSIVENMVESTTSDQYFLRDVIQMPLQQEMNLSSAVKEFKGAEPMVTSWDDVPLNTGCYDFIWYSSDRFECVSVTFEEIKPVTVMTTEFLKTKFSDHIPITAVLKLCDL